MQNRALRKSSSFQRYKAIARGEGTGTMTPSTQVLTANDESLCHSTTTR